MYSENRFSEEKLLGEGNTIEGDVQGFHLNRYWRSHVYFLSFQLIFFLVSCAVLLRALSLQNLSFCCDCKDHVPMYSPALEAVQNTGHMQRFDGSFATPNMFKGPPSAAIDAAWDSITYATGGVVNISEETLHAVNASANYSVKLAPEIGGGYMASVEVLHQLHCLNMLRQATYEDYYHDKAGPWQDSRQTLRYHLDHCIDNLRQKLMCDADTGILTYVWVKGHPMPFPDFSVQHKCRDFKALKDWVVEHQVYSTDSHGHNVRRLPGAKELESPP